jgi:hypothetical protein
MYGFKIAALYTLQHGLTADSENAHGFTHCDKALRGLLDESRPQLFGDADSPRGAGRDLLARDEAIVEPAVKG